MDSTLIETEVIDELAIRAGVGDQVKAITESAMRGEIDFTESFTRRVALLKRTGRVCDAGDCRKSAYYRRCGPIDVCTEEIWL